MSLLSAKVFKFNGTAQPSMPNNPQREGGGGTQKHTAGPIKQAIARLDGVVDLISAGIVVHLPQTEPHEGHLKATV
jgi:hypothetical protein